MSLENIHSRDQIRTLVSAWARQRTDPHATVGELMHSLYHALRRALRPAGTEVGECHLPLE